MINQGSLKTNQSISIDPRPPLESDLCLKGEIYTSFNFSQVKFICAALFRDKRNRKWNTKHIKHICLDIKHAQTIRIEM